MNINSGLDPNIYCSNDIFHKEKSLLFSNLWIFAGVSSFVNEADTYICRRIASTSIFIQNDGNKLNAFINSCPHRNSPIRLEGFGKKKITCPFHGWSFEISGKLKVIPNEHLFNFNPTEFDAITLSEIKIITIGKFIFINFSNTPIDINEQFTDDILEDIKIISEKFDSQIAYSNFSCKYNWKLNLEVIKDPNHIPFVHSQTFMRWLDKSSLTNLTSNHKTSWEDVSNTKLSDLSFKTEGPVIDSKPWYRSMINRHGTDSNHLSWYLYPNTHFASVRGDYFFIQHYDPNSATDMDFHLWVSTATKKDSNTDFTPLLRSLMVAEREVIEEDIGFLTNIQNNFSSFSKNSFHGAYENNILKQSSWYQKNILK